MNAPAGSASSPAGRLAGSPSTMPPPDVRGGAIYLDYQATTPVDRRVLEAMLPFWTRVHANPASRHEPGQRAAVALRGARRQVQSALGARHESEIVFTSGATEANHLAIVGSVAAVTAGGGDHVVTTAIEHKSVLAACDQLVAAGHTVTRVGVDGSGRVDPRLVAVAITPRTRLVSVMYANNEIGSIQPVAEIARITRSRNVLLHVDAVQAIGAQAIDVTALGADLLTISAHKVYGPKGIGALYIRHGTPMRALFPGSQEHGWRAGTVNVAGAIGLATALQILASEREADARRIAGLRDRLASQLLATVPDARVNGSPEHRLPGNLSLTIPGVDGGDLIDALPDVAISAGSACASGDDAPSHVLAAIGLDSALARATVRISLGRFTSDGEIERAGQAISAAVAELRRRRSPSRSGEN